MYNKIESTVSSEATEPYTLKLPFNNSFSKGYKRSTLALSRVLSISIFLETFEIFPAASSTDNSKLYPTFKGPDS